MFGCELLPLCTSAVRLKCGSAPLYIGDRVMIEKPAEAGFARGKLG
jgi:hypothetical protein